MNSIAEAFRMGGIWMYIILALQLMGMGLIAAATIATMLKKRVPWIIWAGCPLMILFCGSLGSYLGIQQAMEAVQMATPENQMKMLAMGYALSLNATAFSSLCAMTLFMGSAMGLGLGTVVGTGSPRKWTPIQAIACVVLGLIATVALFFIGVSMRHVSQWGIAIGVAAFTGALSCALANLSIHKEDDKHAARTASARIGVGVCVVLALYAFGSFADIYGRIELFEALSSADPSWRARLIDNGIDIARKGYHLGLGATIAAIFFGVLPALPSAKRALDRWGIASGVVGGIAIFLCFGVSGLIGMKLDSDANEIRNPTILAEALGKKTPPRFDALGASEVVQSWDLRKAPARDSCFLQERDGGWSLTSAFEPGQPSGEGACEASGEDKCVNKPGPLTGQLCRSLDDLPLVVSATDTVGPLLDHAWGPSPRHMVLLLDASGGRIDAEKFGPLLSRLMVGEYSGIELEVMGREGDIPPEQEVLIMGTERALGYHVVKAVDGTPQQPIPAGSPRELHGVLDGMIGGMPANTRVTIVPASTWTYSTLADACIITHQLAPLPTRSNPFAKKDALAPLGDRFASTQRDLSCRVYTKP